MPLVAKDRYGTVARVSTMPSMLNGESVLFNNLSPAFATERLIIQQVTQSKNSRLVPAIPKDKDWVQLCRRLVDSNFSINYPALLVRKVHHGQDHEDVAFSREIGVALAAWKTEPGMVELSCSCPRLILFLQNLSQWGCGMRAYHCGCEFFFYDCVI